MSLMRAIPTADTAGNETTPVYNGTSSDIGAGLPVQLDQTASLMNTIKLPESPGIIPDFAGITQETIKAGTYGNVITKGYCKAKVLASATTTGACWLFPTTVSGVAFLKECKTHSGILLLEDISASSGSYVSASVYIQDHDPFRGGLVHDIWYAPIAPDTDYVHAAITGSASLTVTTTTGITNPDVPRNLTITPGGTTGDVAAMSITVTGTDVAGTTITEDFAFSANASTATTGNKAFKTVTSISIPPQDGGAATFIVGVGAKLGLAHPIQHTTLGKAAFLDGTLEGTLPTLAGSTGGLPGNIASSTASLNSALNSTQVDVYYVI